MTTETEIETDAEEWLDTLDPATTPAKDARHLREIAAVRERIAEAEQDLRGAVWAARGNGDSWSAIGLALGTTRQAAFQRFGDPPDTDLFPELMAAVNRGDRPEADRVLAETTERGQADSQTRGDGSSTL